MSDSSSIIFEFATSDFIGPYFFHLSKKPECFFMYIPVCHVIRKYTSLPVYSD